MYIEAKDEWFEKRLSKNSGSYLYPKDEFLLSIWDKADEAIWCNIFSNRFVNLENINNSPWSVDMPFDPDDAVFYFQPKSLKQMVKFDNLTDDEKLYLSLKYNLIDVIIKEPNNNVSC